MTDQTTASRSLATIPSRGTAWLGVAGAAVFIAFFVISLVQTARSEPALPLPTESDAVIYDYVTQETAATMVRAVLMFASTIGLACFVAASGRAATRRPAGGRVAWGIRAGWFAVASLTAFSVINAVLALVSSSMSAGAVTTANYVAFLAGGVLHVMALGLLALLSGRICAPRWVRVLSIVAAIPALLSVVSLIIFNATVLVLLGRVLCMVWMLIASIAMVRAASEQGGAA